VGVTVLDAGVVIGLLDSSDWHHDGARRALTYALQRQDELVLPASAYSEVLVAPYRAGAEAVATVDGFVAALPARIEPLTPEIARQAAELRAIHGSVLRLPDALVLATAKALGAQWVVTTDRRWPEVGVAVEEIP
jgi:predicted nucleic acid-binding protein